MKDSNNIVVNSKISIIETWPNNQIKFAPAKPWYVRLYRKFVPLKYITVPADGIIRKFSLNKKNYIYYYLSLLILGYLLVSCLAYRFKHPEMTETQLILNIWNAITWN